MNDIVKQIIERSKNLYWMPAGILYITLHGSRAYGTHTETSDYDYKGFCVPEKEFYLGFSNRFEQAELKDPDTVIYELRKFFTLAAATNPNTVEVLFTDPADHVFVHKVAEPILDAGSKFLSKRARYTFGGYVRSQWHRLDQHHRWLRQEEPTEPKRSDFGLPDRPIIAENKLLAVRAAIKKELDRFNLDFLEDFREDQRIAILNAFHDVLAGFQISKDEQWLCAARTIGLTDNLIEILQKERAYEGKQNEWKQFCNWKKTRNKERAEVEAKFGYDCKHAYHCVRLLRTCRELLETGKVNVRRHDKEELLTIRNGAWSYDKLKEYVEQEDAQLDRICAKSLLPDKPDMAFLDRLCTDTIELMLIEHEC